MPSAIWRDDTGTLLVGTSALDHASLAPERFERAPKRLLDQRMVILGEARVPITTLVARILTHVSEEASRLFNQTRPQAVVLTHPAAWAAPRLALLQRAADDADLGETHMVSEPAAAAVHFATKVPVDSHVVVFDLGGGTFDAAVLVRTPTGFALAGPRGVSTRWGAKTSTST
jgi:molecular chaperone DnaK (HSP70)